MGIQYYGSEPQRIGRMKGAMLAHAMSEEVLGITGRTRTMMRNGGETVLFRRVVPWGATVGANSQNRPVVVANQHHVQEGVTPAADTIKYVDVEVTAQQYACLYKYTDRAADLYEDRIPADMVEQTGERMGLLREMLKYGALKACTNRFWAGAATGRATVNTRFNRDDLRRITRTLLRNHAKKITRVIAPAMEEETHPVEASFLAFGSTDLENDWRDQPGFVHTAEYGSRRALVHMNELGTVENFRAVGSPELNPYKNAGATIASLDLLGTTKVDIYPIIVVARNAWADLTLRGRSSFSPIHLSARTRDKSDPLGQRGYIGAIFYDMPFIENDGWMAVLETGAEKL